MIRNSVRVDSLSLPGLEPYRTMRRPVDHRERGIFVAEGEKVVRRLVESDLSVVSILLTEEWLESYSAILRDRIVEDKIYFGDKSLLEEIVGYQLHQGIMAIGRVPKEFDVAREVPELRAPRLLVALDGIANSENMGVIVRNCAAFGVQALIAGRTSCDPYLRRSVRNSMGTVFRLPVARVDDLAETLRTLRNGSSFQIVAAHPRAGSADIKEVGFEKDTCVVFGSEGEGISGAILDECTLRAQIKMRDDVDSINVASSVAVFLYEVARRRMMP